jgi:dihydropteroate synthase
MGILNVTPDSFWDGGRTTGVEAAVRHAPPAVGRARTSSTSAANPRGPAPRRCQRRRDRRVVPVIAALRARWPDLSALRGYREGGRGRAALDAGASIINDVSGLRLDPASAMSLPGAGAGLILMHSRGDVGTWPATTSLTTATTAWPTSGDLADAVAAPAPPACRHDAIVVDPGLGFAKRTEHSLAVLGQAAIALPRSATRSSSVRRANGSLARRRAVCLPKSASRAPRGLRGGTAPRRAPVPRPRRGRGVSPRPRRRRGT